MCYKFKEFTKSTAPEVSVYLNLRNLQNSGEVLMCYKFKEFTKSTAPEVSVYFKFTEFTKFWRGTDVLQI